MARFGDLVHDCADVPPLIRRSDDASPRARGIGAIVAAGCFAVLATAAALTPSPTGIGTHRQLGLPACGVAVMTGLPCPTCGMTSAFAWMMHGHPLRAVAAQPFGALLCLAVIVAMFAGLWSAWTGRSIEVDWVRVSPVGLVLGLAALLIVSWGAKIAYGLLTGALPYHAAL